MRILPILPIMPTLFLLVASSFAADGPRLDVNANGMVRHLVDWPVEMDCRAGVWIVRDNWKSVRQQWDLKDLHHSSGTPRSMSGTFAFDDGSVALHEQIANDQLSYELSPGAALDVTGAYWFIEFPVRAFANGEVRVGETSFNLAPGKPKDAAIGSANGSSFQIRSKDGTQSVTVRFSESREVRVQDARVFGEDRYQIYTPLTEAPLAAGAKLNFTASVEPHLDRDRSDATITLDTKSIRNEFDGFGGNFVYAIEDPTTQIALDSLKLTWARVGMELAKWEPVNDNGDAKLTNLSALTAADQPGSSLRRRFELDQKLFKQAGGRVIASVWAPPKWLFPLGESKGSIDRAQWDELAECITSYLTHLKNSYGVEPVLFSFNESDIGIDVLLTGEEMRDMTTLLGARFLEAGLRTKILLGDSADLKKGLDQIQPTLSDPEAMKFIGALAYHPWSGQQEHWKAWAEVAEKRGLMLMATEMGDDASAWQDGTFNSPLSTLHLARKYIEQLRGARTQVLLEWEWTGDYAITSRDKDDKLVLSNRGRFLQQLTQTTPTQANVVDAKCDETSITAAAVLADDGKSLAIHLLNGGGERTVRISGLPGALTLATLFVIDPLNGERSPQHIEAKAGLCEFRAPAGAIVTLAFPPIQ